MHIHIHIPSNCNWSKSRFLPLLKPLLVCSSKQRGTIHYSHCTASFYLFVCTYLLLHMQCKLCIAIAFIAYFSGEEVALHSQEIGSIFLLQVTSIGAATLRLVSNIASKGLVHCIMQWLLLNKNTPHTSQPCCFCIAMHLMVTVSFSEWMISIIRSTTVCGIEEYLLSYKNTVVLSLFNFMHI